MSTATTGGTLRVNRVNRVRVSIRIRGRVRKPTFLRLNT